jgi:monoamine oxidase
MRTKGQPGLSVWWLVNSPRGLANSSTPGARFLLDLATRAVFAAEPRDLSLLHVLFYYHSGGGIINLTRRTEPQACCWSNEPWTRGCYAGYFPPGVWIDFGAALRAPVGRIHCAGTETSEVFTGYMDGAVRSGERAAIEVGV